MKYRNVRLYSLVILLLVILLFTGCTRVWNITDTPALQIGSPLRSVEPKTFVFKDFQDIRGVEDPSFMHQRGAHTHLINQPPAVFIADRIKKEFERNGHKCVDTSSQVKADFIVDGKIYKFSFQETIKGWGTTQLANTGVKLTINRVTAESGVLEKSYEGSYTVTSHINTWVVVLGQAVLSMIKDISTDSELIEFIKK